MRIMNELSEEIRIQRGVRQGCVASPTLFNLYTDIFFRHIINMKGVNVGGTNYNNFRYADDTALLAGNEKELSGLTSDTIVVVVNPAAAASGGPKSKSPLESARPTRSTRTMAEVVADPPRYQYVTRQRSRRVRTSSLVTAETKAQPSSRAQGKQFHPHHRLG